MTTWEIRPWIAATWTKEDMSPEAWDAMQDSIRYWKQRTILELNTVFYQNDGDRDAADERLACLSGKL